MNRNYLFVDPDFSKYVFSVMADAKPDQKLLFTPIELRNFRNHKSMKTFADNASMEQKMMMLSKLGVSFVVLFAADPVKHLDILNEITYDRIDADARLDIIKRMKSGKMFSLASREVLISGGLSSSNAHHKVFNLDSRHAKLVELAAKRRHGGSFVDHAAGMLGAYDILAQICTINYSLSSKAQNILDCNGQQLRILVALYRYRNIFTVREKIMELVGSTESPKGFTIMCGEMVKQHLLYRRPQTPKTSPDYNSYMITDTGVAIVVKYLKMVAHSIDE